MMEATENEKKPESSSFGVRIIIAVIIALLLKFVINPLLCNKTDSSDISSSNSDWINSVQSKNVDYIIHFGSTSSHVSLPPPFKNMYIDTAVAFGQYKFDLRYSTSPEVGECVIARYAVEKPLSSPKVLLADITNQMLKDEARTFEKAIDTAFNGSASRIVYFTKTNKLGLRAYYKYIFIADKSEGGKYVYLVGVVAKESNDRESELFNSYINSFSSTDSINQNASYELTDKGGLFSIKLPEGCSEVGYRATTYEANPNDTVFVFSGFTDSTYFTTAYITYSQDLTSISDDFLFNAEINSLPYKSKNIQTEDEQSGRVVARNFSFTSTQDGKEVKVIGKFVLVRPRMYMILTVSSATGQAVNDKVKAFLQSYHFNGGN